MYQLAEGLDFYYRLYDRVFLVGDFNLELTSPPMIEFMGNYNWHCLFRGKTCFKTDKGTCIIDLMLTNCKHSFKFSSAIETGLSDHHLMVYKGGVRFAGGRDMRFLVAGDRYIVKNCPGCRDLIGCPVPGNNKYTSRMPRSVKLLPGRRYSLI